MGIRIIELNHSFRWLSGPMILFLFLTTGIAYGFENFIINDELSMQLDQYTKTTPDQSVAIDPGKFIVESKVEILPTSKWQSFLLSLDKSSYKINDNGRVGGSVGNTRAIPGDKVTVVWKDENNKQVLELQGTVDNSKSFAIFFSTNKFTPAAQYSVNAVIIGKNVGATTTMTMDEFYIPTIELDRKKYSSTDMLVLTIVDPNADKGSKSQDSISNVKVVGKNTGKRTDFVVNESTKQGTFSIKLGVASYWSPTPPDTITVSYTYNYGKYYSGTISITVNVISPPVAQITGPNSGDVNEKLVFSGEKSYDPDGSITSYSWDFGDKSTGYGANVSHAYSNAGTYYVTFTVTDNDGLKTTSVAHKITINSPNLPPVAQITGPNSADEDRENIYFSGNNSYDPDGSITNYFWNFGDISFGSGESVIHRYRNPGTYYVTLTVTDNDGLQTMSTAHVVTINYVENPTPQITGPSSAHVGEQVSFSEELYDSSWGDYETMTVWNFGDGEYGIGKSITHTYSNPDTYHVIVTMKSLEGARHRYLGTSEEHTITIISKDFPVAQITGPNSVDVNTNISFSGTGSYDPDGYITNYSWNFGDGNIDSGPNVSYAYSNAGTYYVTLTVTDDDGQTNTSPSHKVSVDTVIIEQIAGTFSADTSPNFVTINQGDSFSLTVNGLYNGEPVPVTATCSSNYQIQCDFSSNAQFEPSTTVQIDDDIKPGIYDLTITVNYQEFSKQLFTTVTVNETIQDFIISASPASLKMKSSDSTNSQISVTRDSGNISQVSLSCSSTYPSKISCSILQPNVFLNAKTTLVVDVENNASPGNYKVYVIGKGANITHQKVVNVTIENEEIPQNASFELNLDKNNEMITPGKSVSVSLSIEKVANTNAKVVSLSCNTLTGYIDCQLPNKVTPTNTVDIVFSTTDNIEPGKYPITIKGNNGDVEKTKQFILKINEPPNAVIEILSFEGNEDSTTYSFSSEDSIDPDGTIQKYEWDFGDGTTTTKTNPAHKYENPGTYKVTLKVIDNFQAADIRTTTITVKLDSLISPEMIALIGVGSAAAVGGGIAIPKLLKPKPPGPKPDTDVGQGQKPDVKVTFRIKVGVEIGEKIE